MYCCKGNSPKQGQLATLRLQVQRLEKIKTHTSDIRLVNYSTHDTLSTPGASIASIFLLSTVFGQQPANQRPCILFPIIRKSRAQTRNGGRARETHDIQVHHHVPPPPPLPPTTHTTHRTRRRSAHRRPPTHCTSLLPFAYY